MFSTGTAATTCTPACGSSITCWSLTARHGGFDLTIDATGDLDVDAHHTVEDVGIALGEAVSLAVGSKRGINRAGYFVMPMDETLAVAAIDLSGRPFAVVDLAVRAARVGDLPTELVRDFFRGVCRRGARQRARQGAVRPVEPSQDRSGVQGVRASAARRLLEGSAACRACCRPRKGCCKWISRSSTTVPATCTRSRRAFGPSAPTSASSPTRAQLGTPTPWSSRASATSARRAALDDAWRGRIRERVERGAPLLGICVGMQWLFEGSEEAPDTPGFGVLPGRCFRLSGADQGAARRLEHADDRRRRADAPSRRSAVRRVGVLHPHLRRAVRR